MTVLVVATQPSLFAVALGSGARKVSQVGAGHSAGETLRKCDNNVTCSCLSLFYARLCWD